MIFYIGDIIYTEAPALNNRLFKILNIEDDRALIEDVIVDTQFEVELKDFKKFDTRTLNLSKPYLLVLAIDSKIIDDIKVIDLYNEYHNDFLQEHSQFIDYMKKRSPLSSWEGDWWD